MGLSSTRISEPMRRDRLLLVSAFATALLTLLGAVGESLGMDRLLQSNTGKTRTHSLFRQGCMLYELIPNMPEHRLAPLMEKFAEAVAGPELPRWDWTRQTRSPGLPGRANRWPGLGPGQVRVRPVHLDDFTSVHGRLSGG